MKREDFKAGGKSFPVPMSDEFFSLVKDMPPPTSGGYSHKCVAYNWELSKDLEPIKGAWYDIGAVFEEDGRWRLVNSSSPLIHGCAQYSREGGGSYDDILYWCLCKLDAFEKGLRGSGTPTLGVLNDHSVWENYLYGAYVNNQPINAKPIDSILDKPKHEIKWKYKWDSAELLLVSAYNNNKMNFFNSLVKYMKPKQVYQLGPNNLRFLESAVNGGLDMRELITSVSNVLHTISREPKLDGQRA